MSSANIDTVKKAEIVALHKQGLSNNEISREIGVTTMPATLPRRASFGGSRRKERRQSSRLGSIGFSHDDAELRKLYSLSMSQLRGNESIDYHFKPSPYYIRWVHGYNPKVGCINLFDKGVTEVFYSASNFGIIYNWVTNQMKILQGHRHMITNIATDAQGRWLVTADTGPENVIIVWEHRDCFPQRTIFNPHRNVKLSKLAISGDAKYLVTIGYKRDIAEVFWWIWSYGHSEPDATTEIPIAKNSIAEINFHPENSLQFVLMTKHVLWIVVSEKIWVKERGVWKETDNYQLKYRCPEKPQVADQGRMTCFTYISTSSQVLVGTSRGYILVFGYTMEYKLNVDSSNYENFRFIKALKVESHRINCIKWIDGVVAVGNGGGEIRFYDDQVKILYWVHGFKLDSIKGLSFNISPRSYMILDPACNKKCLCWEEVVAEKDPETGQIQTKMMKKKIPEDCTKGAIPFVIRDFIVVTNNTGIGFVDFVPEKNNIILEYRVSPVLTLTIHPEKTFFCVGYLDGVVDLVSFIGRHKLRERVDLRDFYKVVIPPKADSIKGDYTVSIPHLSVTCLKYSPSGLHLACGLNTGELLFVDPFTLEIRTQTPFKDTSHAIKEMNYSPDSETLACADIGKTVLVYKFDRADQKWSFIGKHRAHYKEVTTVFFLNEKNPDGEFKLLSFGLDRIMVEYNIGACTGDESLPVYSIDRIDQTAIPLNAMIWPTPLDLNPEECNTNMPLILVCNDEFKYKIMNYKTAMTLATYLGPRFEHPVKQNLLTTHIDEEKKTTNEYLLFCTKNVIGLQKMPIDGNPWKHIGMLGHPNRLYTMCYRQDHAALFTIGAKDCCVSQWVANFRAVEKTTILGGTDLDPYYCLIENGRPGWLFQEIRDLFYYIQILCQGTFSPAMRKVKDWIPIGSMPDLMRALGFFPSEYEVENLLVESRYKVYNKSPDAELDFEEFVKLYLNHRPAFPEGPNKMRDAFKHFATGKSDTGYIHRDDFIDILSDKGERFSKELSWYLLSILSGHSFEDRALSNEGDFSYLPTKIKMADLLVNILGIPESDTLSEIVSVVPSGTSVVGELASSTDSDGECDFEKLFS